MKARRKKAVEVESHNTRGFQGPREKEFIYIFIKVEVVFGLLSILCKRLIEAISKKSLAHFLCWSRILSPRKTTVCLRLKIRLRLEIEPKSFF